MERTRSLLFLGILAANNLCVECQCASEKIPALSFRSRINEVQTSSLDDTFLPSAWYSAVLGGDTYRIPDDSKVPVVNTCGAYSPIYIEGTHPDVAELDETGFALSACIRTEFDICESKLDILIRVCEGEVQYYLVPTYSPYSAYCLDPPNLQDTADADFEDAPENVNIQSATIRTSLQYVDRLPKIVIDCDVQTDGNTAGLLFVTAWYVNSEAFFTFTNVGRTSPFTEDELAVSGLGINISCSAGLKKSEFGKTTPFVSSDTYFAGIKVLNPEINLGKSETAMVQLKNTLPIGVRDSSNRDPKFRSIQMVFDDDVCSVGDGLLKEPPGIEADKRACGTNFETLYPGDTWDPAKVEIKTMEIATKDLDKTDKGRYVFQLEVQDSFEHPIWNGYRLEDVSVTVYDSEVYTHAICKSTNDPHMTTSDGYPYEHQYAGDFILYRNKKYPIDVQMRTKLCNNNIAYCACAVAIRAGGDVFLIDHCDLKKRMSPMTSCSDEGILDITRDDDQHFEINTPIGTKITINLSKHNGLMNVAIKMAPKDENNVEGLCGNFDGDKNNDLIDRNGQIHTLGTHSYRNYHATFSESWRVTDKNYLNHNEKCLDNVETWEDTRTSLYCTCSCLHQNSTCEDPIPYCSPSQYLSCPIYNSDIVRTKCTKWKKRCNSSRRKRQAEMIPLVFPEAIVRQKRESKIFTEEEAEELCRNAISDQQMINGIEAAAQGFNVTQAIYDCVFDTVEGQSDEWVQGYVRELSTVVKINLEKDPQFAEANKEKVEVFERQSCLSNCSGNGVCTLEGVCNCYEGFSGSDCTISNTTQLNLYGVEGNGICDLQHGDGCDSFEMFTIDLMNDFVCRIVEQLVLLNGSKIELLPLNENGEFIDNYNGECFLHSARKRRSADESVVVLGSTYDMYISNDGKTFSNRAPLIVFDSLCQTVATDANGDTIYVLNKGTCFINGRCYSSSEYNVYESCEKCFPEINPFQWTRDCADDTVAVNVLPIVLGTVVPTVVILLAVAAICFAHKHYGKQKRCVTPTNQKFGGLS